MPTTKASASITAHYITTPKDAVGYELISLDSTVNYASDGTPSIATVSVTAYKRQGTQRTALPVNGQVGAQHLVLFRRTNASGTDAPAELATSYATASLSTAKSARFDLLQKSAVTTQTVGGKTVYSYAAANVLATQPITLTHDGTQGDPGQNAIFARLDPPALTLKKGQPAPYQVKIYVVDGSTEKAPDSFSVLTADQKQGFADVQHTATVGYTFIYDGTTDISRDIPVTVNGKYHVTLPVRTVTDGSSGASGAITVVTKWANATAYSDGKTAGASGLRVINIVYTESTVGQRTYYVCHKSHTSAAASCPTLGTSWATYWTQLSNVGPIFSDFILASKARIDLLDSQEIILWHSDANGNPVMDARIGPPTADNSQTIAWFGGSTPSAATTWISNDGTLHTRKADIEGDVTFGGRIKPMKTVITSSNYALYRIRMSDKYPELAAKYPESSNSYTLDFCKLTGHVTFDSTLNSVSSSACPRGFCIGCKYPDGVATVTDLEDYIGQRLVVKNNTTSQIGVAGYIVTDISSTAPSSPIIYSGYEIHLRCFIKNQSGKKVIGWLLEYSGPQ